MNERLLYEHGYRLALARSAANDAVRAVALERDRIGDRDDDAYFAAARFRQEVDVAFLLIALRWLREVCPSAQRHGTAAQPGAGAARTRRKALFVGETETASAQSISDERPVVARGI